METIGIVIVCTGEGKGKTTSALGMALRAWGNGMKVLILQFIKGGQKYGEMDALEKMGEISEGRIELRQCGKGFTRRGGDEEEHLKAAEAAWEEAEREIFGGSWDMVILDEINYAVKFGLIPEEKVLSMIERRPPKLHIVLTGRYATETIIEKSDLVTEMRLVKHPFQDGVKAQKGIEF